MSHDRRIHARLAARVPAKLHRGSEVLDGVVENIGEGGVFFATDVLELPVDDGAEVTVEFEARRHGTPEAFRVAGTVLRAERYFDGDSVVRAFAIRFAERIEMAGLSVG